MQVFIFKYHDSDWKIAFPKNQIVSISAIEGLNCCIINENILVDCNFDKLVSLLGDEVIVE